MLQLKPSNACKKFVRSFENSKVAFLQINYLLCNPELKERDNKQVKIHKTSYELLTMINNYRAHYRKGDLNVLGCLFAVKVPAP